MVIWDRSEMLTLGLEPVLLALIHELRSAPARLSSLPSTPEATGGTHDLLADADRARGCNLIDSTLLELYPAHSQLQQLRQVQASDHENQRAERQQDIISDID